VFADYPFWSLDMPIALTLRSEIEARVKRAAQSANDPHI